MAESNDVLLGCSFKFERSSFVALSSNFSDEVQFGETPGLGNGNNL